MNKLPVVTITTYGSTYYVGLMTDENISARIGEFLQLELWQAGADASKYGGEMAVFNVTVVEMAEEAYEALPEFDGW